MSVALGGSIKQTIKRDYYDPEKWLSDRTLRFNVQLLNSELFQKVTGKQPPPTPVSAQVAVASGLPFFELQEEASNIHGHFNNVKSVAEIDNIQEKTIDPTIIQLSTQSRLDSAYEETKKRVHDPDGLLDSQGPIRDFRTIGDMHKDLARSKFTLFEGQASSWRQNEFKQGTATYRKA